MSKISRSMVNERNALISDRQAIIRAVSDLRMYRKVCEELSKEHKEEEYSKSYILDEFEGKIKQIEDHSY